MCWEYTREEEFTTASPRHPMKITVKLGAKADGTLTAFQFRNVSNTGAYGNHGGETLFAGGAASMHYRCPNKKFDALLGVHQHRAQRRAARVRHDPAGVRRGVGDDTSSRSRSDIDPLELRRRNVDPAR